MFLLWILPLAASFLLPATGEVVQSFSTCSQFFLDGTPPYLNLNLNPMNLTRICQTYDNQYRFATLYDRNRRIPIFSAYKYQPGTGNRQATWKVEPQLVSLAENKNMVAEKDCPVNRAILAESQALSKDYSNTGYDRGHLAPSCHQKDQASKNATFTLTNIVPQCCELNKKKWSEYEKNMTNFAKGCRETYIIVGAVPGNDFLRGHRVNIPRYIWAASCCVIDNNQKRSRAILAENNQNKVELHTLKGLQKKLDKLYEGKVNLFNNACQGGLQK